MADVRCLVIGTGKMGMAHLQVLAALKPTALCGFAPSDRRRAEVEALGVAFRSGALDRTLAAVAPTHVIAAAPMEALPALTAEILAAGVRRVLIEKPAALDLGAGERLLAAAGRAGAAVWVGYNRRCYASIRTARELIRHSGEPITSVAFEFTEIADGPHGAAAQPEPVRRRWLLANSMHVIDAALHPVGLPDPARSLMLAHGALSWHPAASAFVGAGLTETGVPFSYSANWAAPGRWGFDWMTASTRYVFRPLERLQVMRRGSFALEEIPLADDADRRFKPGVYAQDRAFLADDPNGGLVPLAEALRLIPLAAAMAGYGVRDAA